MERFGEYKGIAALYKQLPTVGLALLLGIAITGCDSPENAVTAPKIVAGAAHACAFDADREQTVCWGDNSYGQLGNEEFSAEGVSAPVRVKVVSGRKIKSLSAGYSHTCALVAGDKDTENTVACWGYNHYGQVGNGTNQDVNVPVFVNGPDGNPLKGVKTLSTGAYHTCASIVKGSPSDPSNYVATTYCWGRNDKGQIGNGALTNVNVPTEIKGLDYSSGVAAGTAHTCALTAKNTDDAQAKKYIVMCWGDASRGQMRDAKVEGGYTATPVDIGLPLQGDDDGFPALFSEHVVQADVTTATGKPVKGEAALTAAPETPAYGQTCAISADQVQCWGGTNQNGQWGTDKKDVKDFAVKTEEIVSGSSLKAYGAGNAQSCMLVGTGDSSSANEVACWGYSSSLGFDMPEDATDAVVASNRLPVTLQGQRPTGLAVGREFVCYAAKGDQPQIWCWGTGKKGQIGNGRVDGTRVPQCVKGYCPDTRADRNLAEGQPFEEAPGAAPSALKIDASRSGNCVVMADTTVWCWGITLTSAEDKQFIHPLPQNVAYLGAIPSDFQTSAGHHCALMSSGGVNCWGRYVLGRDGSGLSTGLSAYSPLAPFPGYESDIAMIENDQYGTCAVTKSDIVKCKLALDSLVDLSVAAPGKVVSLSMLQVPFVGPCVLVTTGSVQCIKDPRNPAWSTLAGQYESGVKMFDANDESHCGVLTDGKVTCHFDSDTEIWGTTDVTVTNLTSIKSLHVGGTHACAITQAGGVKCWGYGYFGQHGNGIEGYASEKYRAAATDVVGLQSGVLDVALGGYHACALQFGGMVKCWGNTLFSTAVPVAVDFGGKYGLRGEIVVKGENLTEGKNAMKATITIPTLTGDLGYGFDCEGNGSYEIDGKVAGHECFYKTLPSGVHKIGYKITTQVLFGTADVTGATNFTVENLPPVITAVNYDSGVIPAGSNAAKTFTITSVLASDPGNDALTYSYDCNLDGKIEGAAEGNLGHTNAICDLSGLAPGTYSLVVVVTDADHAVQGNGLTTKPITVTIVPPLDTQIDSKPPAYSGADVTFTFSSAQTSTIEYRIHGAAFAVTTAGTASYAALTDGTHTFYAQAVSGGNADATPASYTWIVDTVAPVTVSDTTFTQPVSVDTVTILFSATDANAGVGFTYGCRLDGGSWVPCDSGIDIGPLVEGFHTFDVAATDAAGNPTTMPATVSWAYWIPPETTLESSGPAEGSTSSATTATFTFTSPTATSFECKLDNGAFEPCESGKTYAGLEDGSHTVTVRAINNGQPDATVATRTWIVVADTDGPVTVGDTIFTEPVSTTSVTIEFHATDANAGGITFQCSLDGDALVDCVSGQSFGPVIGEGPHDLLVAATDAANNPTTSPATITWEYWIPPETTLDASGPAADGTTSSTSATFTFSSATATSFACKLNEEVFATCTSPKNYTGLLDGANTFTVRAIRNGVPDETGSTRTWSVDTSGGASASAVTGATLATGTAHACAVANGSLYCWGTNLSGQLGDVTGLNTSPSQMGSATDWASVSAGPLHTCGIRTSGALYCWGSNSNGQIGDPNTSTFSGAPSPVAVAAGQSWLKVSAIDSHTCAVRDDHSLWCWGDTSMGQLGTGVIDYNPVTAPVQVGVAVDWVDVTGGYGFTCARNASREVYCWGDNSMGQLGTGTVDAFSSPQTAAATGVAMLAAGGQVVCAVNTDGTLWCWGDNSQSQGTGDGMVTPYRTTATQVGTDTDWASVEIGVMHTCALKTGRTLWCWGDQTNNALGDDASSGTQMTPLQIGADTDWLEISCNQGFCLGMHDTVGKDVFSWGDNGFSQCGTDGMITPVVSPMMQLTPF